MLILFIILGFYIVDFNTLMNCVQINQDRNGKQVQQDLLKDVLTFSTFFAEIGEQKIEYYETFEQVMLKEAASYYAQLASELLCCRSYTDYIQTVVFSKC